MAKDKSLLGGVSVFFTEETLEDIVRKASGEKEVKILSWDFGEGSRKGDSYLSVIDRIKVKGEAAGKPIETSLVTKSFLKKLGARKTFRCAEFFHNEITFYTEVFPQLREFLKSKGQDNMMVVPRCLAALRDGENDFMALEDVSVLGFGPITRQNSLGLSECSVILKALAKFHAVSFAYKDQHKEEFQKLADKLRETYFTPEAYNWFKRYQALVLSVSRDALARECPGSEVEKRFNSWSGEQIYYKSIEFCSRTQAPTSVILHGDPWPPNFLISKSDAENPIALALDFQTARCASPILDLSHFIYACTEKSLRDKHYIDLYKIYHNELSKSITSLGSDPDKLYPWDVLMKEIEELSMHGLSFAVEAIPVSMLPASEAYDMDAIDGDQVVDISEIWKLQPIKSQEGRRRLVDVITHAVENNYL